MHNVFRLPDKRPRVVDHLSTEMDAVAAARTIAAKISDYAQQQEQGRSTLSKHMEAVSRAGLFGISVPSDHGGADITNTVLAEIVAMLTESDPRLGEKLKLHFQVVEAIRLFASEGQQAVHFAHALTGEQFALATSLADHDEKQGRLPNLLADRTGFCLQAPACVTVNDFCDWIAVPALDPKGHYAMALLAREAEDVSLRRMSDLENLPACGVVQLDLSECHVQADALVKMTTGPDGLLTLKSLGKLLDAAVDLGIARAIFTNFRQGHAEADTNTHAVIGRLFAQIEGVAALIERAGQKLDVAQVNSTHESGLDAFLSASAAVVLAADGLNDMKAQRGEISTRIDESQTSTHVNEPTGAADNKSASGDQRSRIVLGRFHAEGILPVLSPFG